jgi:hypothetical protein
MKNFGFCRSCGIKQKYDDRLGNQQSMLLQEIKVVLLASFPRTTVKDSGPIVEVGFSDYNVEVAPVWGLENQFSYVCMTANGGSYERADYHVETNAISISNTITNGNTRHLVRMMKCWQGQNNVPLRSFYIELLAIGFLGQWPHAGNSKTYYDWMCRDFFKYILERENSNVYAPGTNEAMPIGDAWSAKARTAQKNACSAIENEASDVAFGSVYWRYIFGPQMKFKSE